MRNPHKSLIKFYTIFLSSIALLTILIFSACQPPEENNWWSLSDKAFAEKFKQMAFSTDIGDQSTVAWMLFARVNKQKQHKGESFSEWELWPSNDDTFNPSTETFMLENKERKLPQLQTPKLLRTQLIKAHLSLPPDSGGEEVTRNALSYDYIFKRGLNTKAGVWKVLKSDNPKVDFPIGTVEIKADWSATAVDGAYQVTDETSQITYSLLGLHIMAKMAPLPDDPFHSEQTSWFWTTFEFKGNPGLVHAQSLITYKDELTESQANALLAEAGLANTMFKNYRSNGSQIRYSDQQNPNIILGNTLMEDFAGIPDSSSPAVWTKWNSSCHTCHGTTSAFATNADTTKFYPFSVPIGKIKDSKIDAYTSLDFVWSIAFHAK